MDDGAAGAATAVPSGVDVGAGAWLAVLACLPYLTLKTAWVAGSPVGIPPGSPLLDHSLVLRL
ncbi:hypothetical protein ACFWDZ_29990, partial [Micromonospora aurantiaca]|uniref:hypothetical protein n=1 Tax=Micromonospora aurantiaca (nom. illeg.) TaxID=47850 RepID=UPI0036637111